MIGLVLALLLWSLMSVWNQNMLQLKITVFLSHKVVKLKIIHTSLHISGIKWFRYPEGQWNNKKLLQKKFIHFLTKNVTLDIIGDIHIIYTLLKNQWKSLEEGTPVPVLPTFWPGNVLKSVTWMGFTWMDVSLSSSIYFSEVAMIWGLNVISD